jgi:hypothetical protein
MKTKLTKEQEKEFLQQVTRADPLDDVSIEDLIQSFLITDADKEAGRKYSTMNEEGRGGGGRGEGRGVIKSSIS